MISYRRADLLDKIKDTEEIKPGDIVTLSEKGQMYFENLAKRDPKAAIVNRTVGTVTFSHLGQIYIRWNGSFKDEQWGRHYIKKLKSGPEQNLQVGDRVKAQKWFIDRLLSENSVDFTNIKGTVKKLNGFSVSTVRWDGDEMDDQIENNKIERV